MDAPQSRSRPRKRPRVSESGNTANPVATPNQGWGPTTSPHTHGPHPHAHVVAHSSHPQAVRAHSDTVPSQPPTFPSQHLDRSHHQQQVVADPDGLMNGYSAPQQHSQHSQYADQASALAAAQQADPTALGNLATLTGDGSATNQHQQHPHQGHQGQVHSHPQHQAHQAHQQHLAQQQQQQQQLAQQHLSQQQQQHHSQHLSQQQQQQAQQHQHQLNNTQQQQSSQQQQQQQQQQQRSSAANTTKTDRPIFQQYGANHAGTDASPTAVAATSAAPFGHTVWSSVASSTPPAPVPAPAPPSVSTSMPPQSPAPGLAPPPEGIYRTFDDLLASVQKSSKDQGYGIVKLRASNYREGKPTRYDLVCDRGGVKYNSTAKKRNPSTRKVDCPFRAKAVCEVNLGHQWRFAVQEGRHNHEPRVPVAVPSSGETPVAQTVRSIAHKVDRLSHEMQTGFTRLEAMLGSRLSEIEKRIESMESSRQPMLGGNGVPSMGTPSMPTANMGGSLGNGSLTNGGLTTGTIVDSRLNNIEARVSGLEQRGMDTMPLIDDETGRLTMMVPS